MKKYFQILITVMCISCSGYAQNVNIPDANFKAVLLTNTSINTDADVSEISIQEAEAYNGTLNVSNKEISSLEGIEAFVNITELECGLNKISSIDASMNLKLTLLNCELNVLTSLVVNKNTALNFLRCTGNQLTELNVSENTSLTSLICSRNQFQTLDISKNILLTSFWCNNHDRLTSLDVSKNNLLSEFYCIENPNLTCIGALNSQDKTYWQKDDSAVFSENCTTGVEDAALKTSKTIANVYNMQGLQVNKHYTGLVIYQYTDGSTEKVVQE